MEITRGRGISGTPLLPQQQRKNAGPKQTNAVSEGTAQTAEREASRRILEASRAVRDAEIQANNQIEAEREKYQQRSISEMHRQDAAYEAQREKGDEVIQELKRKQQQEISRIRREGEREIANLQAYYNATLRKLETEGRQKVDNENRFSQQQLEYDKRNASEEIEQARLAHRQQLQHTKNEFEHQTQTLLETQKAETERLRESLSRLSAESEQAFNEKYKANMDRQQKQLSEMSSRASEKLREIRADTSAKLAAYASRQSDPFYKMLTHDAELEETDDEFIVTAKIPEHEQRNVSVSIKGNQLVISGYRRNEEKLELAPGRMQGTASYQSFSETFPLTYPVDAKNLSKRFDGDTLIVTVPKTAQFKARPQYQAKAKAEPVRVERPQFPENLPHVGDSHERDHSAGGSSKPGRGSGTLT